MLGGDLAQALQVADRGQDHAGRARHRFDDHSGDVLRAVQRDQPLQLVGLFHAILRQAAAEGIARQVQRVWQVVDPRQQGAEGAAVVRHAADRDATEADAVISQFAADQARARALADGALVGQRDLQRSVHRLRARVGEEHPAEPGGGDVAELLGQLEGQRMTHLEGRREVHLCDLPADRFADFASAVAGVTAPEAGGAIEDLAAVAGGVVEPLGLLQQARAGLELAVGGKGHPEMIGRGAGVEIVGHGKLRQECGFGGYAVRRPGGACTAMPGVYV